MDRDATVCVDDLGATIVSYLVLKDIRDSALVQVNRGGSSSRPGFRDPLSSSTER